MKDFRSKILSVIIVTALVSTAMPMVFASTTIVEADADVPPIFDNAPPNYTPHTVPRVVLMEDNTNWGCGPCASHNPAWTAAIEAEGYYKVAPSYVHVHWPSATDPVNLYDDMYTWANGRRSAEGCTWAPWPIIDGAYTDYGQKHVFILTQRSPSQPSSHCDQRHPRRVF